MKAIFITTVSATLASIAFVSGEPDMSPASKESVAKLEERVSRDGSDLTVEVFTANSLSNWHYEIKINVAGDPAQTIAIRNGQELKKTDIQLVDLNGDGFLDLMIVGGQDHRDKPWFKTWIFSPETKQYQWIGAIKATKAE